jgi:Leu/Phe-tRNA-protein transferase
MIDCQMNTPLLSSFGAREISRDEFNMKLAKITAEPFLSKSQ